jgi:hypothetical protein
MYGQWFIENIADPAHLKYVHGAQRVPDFGEYRWNGANWGVNCDQARPRFGTQGISMIVTKGHPTQIPLGDYDYSEQVNIAAVTPVDDCVTDVWLPSWVVKEEGYPDEVGPRALKGYNARVKNVSLDFALFDHMIYREGPVWPPEESKMWNDVRKWCRYFYPADTGLRDPGRGSGVAEKVTRDDDAVVGGRRGKGPSSPYMGGRAQ